MPSRADFTSDGSEGENFEADIDAVDDAELLDDDDSSGDELSTLRTILSIPPPNAPMHEVHKVSAFIYYDSLSCSNIFSMYIGSLETAQQAYNSLRVDFKGLKKDYLALSATVPACS
jgi:hypothetical protein